ncbi:MAG TPA: hypothetical protein VHH73_05910, partial [Verrucomicrobiae bacterium]|nr:hypothetical protein [Verrucomicrobiae bacterium]
PPPPTAVTPAHSETPAPLTANERRELLQLRGEVANLRQRVQAGTPAPLPDLVTAATNSPANTVIGIIRSGSLPDVWPADSIKAEGNATPLEALKTVIVTVLSTDFDSFYGLLSTNSPTWTADQTKAREAFAGVEKNHHDVKEINSIEFTEYTDGKIRYRYSILRTRKDLPAEISVGTVDLQQQDGVWRLYRYRSPRILL